MTIDTTTNALMQQIQTPALTTLSKFIDIIFQPEILITASILIGIFLYAKNQKKKGILLSSTMIITGAIILILKETIQRARPIIAESYSFPSGHTTATLVFFGLIAFLFTNKKHKLTTTIITTLIILLSAFTRLYLQVHWLIDIIASLIIGTIILTTAILIYKKIT